ncbi:MAG TPA: pyrimidine-nucleoside phosphorylase, partial [Clostridiales bacterium]|nr:pyrimidine-nucleoside phosphorylase [Clostridiales bacterium]
MIAAQGGDPRVCEDITLLPQARIQLPVPVAKGAYLQGMDAQAIGLAAQHLGAGRLSKEDVIDPAVGLVMHHRIGDYVAAGDAVATIHANDARKAEEAARKVLDALIWGDHSVPPAKLLYASIDDQHMEVFA